VVDSKEIIQDRMLSNISDEYDKTEGSFFYDAIKPVAIELENLDIKANDILNKGFADTATGADLERICGEQGIYRKPATKATNIVTITGTEAALIVKGEMVASDNASFVFTVDDLVPANGIINVTVECTEYGLIGNVPEGTIKYFPKTLEGLQTVTNPQTFSNGYDAESDESLRQRYYDKVRTPATSGNKYHYLNWAKEVIGVGDARIFPLANGPGTVKVVIINSNKRAADINLLDSVLEHIEDSRPIGVTVDLDSAVEKSINVSVTLVIDVNNYTSEQVEASIESNLIEHFASIAFINSYVSYASIGNIIFNTDGVLDYSNLKINNGTINIAVADTEVAVLGGVTIG
jgi:uncharacterized phage protein gp47/JayE